MKKFLAFIICAIFCCGEAAAQQHHSRGHHNTRHHRVIRQEDKIAHDTLPAPKNIADSIIFEATKYLGIPYRYATHGPNSFDCSGFTGHIYRLFGYNIGYASREQYQQGAKISKHNLHKGDLVFFCGRQINGTVGHVGIVFDVDTVAGTFRFIHASCSRGVNITSYPDSKYYLQRYLGARRFIDYNDKPIKEQKEENPLGIDHSPFKLDKAKHDSVNITPREEIIVTHNVSAGETLKSIAEKYNCTPEDIARWNNIRLHNEILKPGRKIIIKPEEETGKIKAEKERNALATDTSIVVRKGETIWTVSQKYNCTVKELTEWNQLKNNEITPGQSLIIRPSSKIAPNDSLANGAIYHKVAKGENIYTIARKYKCTKEEIKEWNGLKKNIVSTGQTLIIKRFDKGNTHTLRKGEDLNYVSAKYGIPVKQLMEWNKLHTMQVKEGQIIVLSSSEKGFEDQLPPTSKIDTTLTLAQQMERNDHLKSKASENKKKNAATNTSVRNDVQAKNTIEEGKDKGNTPKGQQSENNASEETIYYAVNGDNLSRIAKKNKCTIKQLYEWNDLKNDKVRLGQKFIIKK